MPAQHGRSVAALQKEEMGEALHEVDFQQLKIENAQFLVKDIAQRKDSLEKIAREALVVEGERVKAEVLNKKLRRQLAEYRVPPVLNYVHEKMTVHDLENSLKIWERKVEIVEMALKSYQNVWHKAKTASRQLQAHLPEQQRLQERLRAAGLGKRDLT